MAAERIETGAELRYAAEKAGGRLPERGEEALVARSGRGDGFSGVRLGGGQGGAVRLGVFGGRSEKGCGIVPL